MHQVSITGQAGEVRWGYHTAATLASWSVTGGDKLTATIVSSDAFRVSQHPLTFQVRRPSGHVWTWAIQSLQIAGTTLQASLAQE